MPSIMIERLSKEEKKALDFAKIRGEYGSWKEMLLDHQQVNKKELEIMGKNKDETKEE